MKVKQVNLVKHEGSAPQNEKSIKGSNAVFVIEVFINCITAKFYWEQELFNWGLFFVDPLSFQL